MAEIVVRTSFFDAFWPALAAGMIAGVVVLAVGYVVVNWLLGLRERAKNDRRTREAVLRIVHGELLHNASQHTTLRESLPNMETAFPGFQLEGWMLVSQMSVLLTVRPEATDRLVHAYNRMRSCNDQLEELRDLLSGPSSLQVALALSSSKLEDGSDPPAMDVMARGYEKHKSDLRDGLLRRLGDLKPYLDDAIDAVEAEIKITVPAPAARRVFRHTQKPDYISGEDGPVGAG